MFKTSPFLLMIVVLGCYSGRPAEEPEPSETELGFPVEFAYTSRQGDKVGIYVRTDGTDTLLTREFKFAEAPAWSPDGKKLVFHSNDAGNFDVYVLDVAAGKSKRLTSSPGNETHPDWSPNGKTIAFVSDQRKPGVARDIYLMDADGGNVRRLAFDFAGGEYPAWSPDGKLIAFSGPASPRTNLKPDALEPNPETAISDIYVVRPDGTGLKKLTDGKSTAFFPTWSPDGKQLAFNSSPSDRFHCQIAIMNADGSNRRHVTWSDPHNLGPNWSQHKAKILFYTNARKQPHISPKNKNSTELWVVNFDATGQKQLTYSAGDNYLPVWRPIVKE